MSWVQLSRKPSEDTSTPPKPRKSNFFHAKAESVRVRNFPLSHHYNLSTMKVLTARQPRPSRITYLKKAKTKCPKVREQDSDPMYPRRDPNVTFIPTCIRIFEPRVSHLTLSPSYDLQGHSSDEQDGASHHPTLQPPRCSAALPVPWTVLSTPQQTIPICYARTANCRYSNEDLPCIGTAQVASKGRSPTGCLLMRGDYSIAASRMSLY